MNAGLSRSLLLLAGAMTLVVCQFEAGRALLIPFTWLATFAHEMGHGLTAVLLGGDFDSLEMYANGSGLAHWQGNVGRLARGLIAAGGLIGPSILGAVILILSRRAHRARILLNFMAIFMLVALVLVARNGFAVAFMLSTAVAFGLVARFFPKTLAPFLVQLVGLELCISVFRDVGYMFSEGARVGGVTRPSDSAAIADALFLPYWFWGGLVMLSSFSILGGGLYLALKAPLESKPKTTPISLELPRDDSDARAP